MGNQQIKNIDRPIRVWQLALEATIEYGAARDDNALTAIRSEEDSVTGYSPPTEATVAIPQDVLPLAQTGKPSIAVLPFDNLSSDPDQGFLADGITEDVTSNISKFHWLRVIAGRSTSAYKGQLIDVREIAKELGVRYLLEGSIRRGGQRVRITAKLADAETGNHLWSERYDRELSDIFDLQDEITLQVAATLMPQLEVAEQKRSFGKKPENLGAWDYYLRGLAFEYDFSKEGNINAREMYTKAAELDPTYGRTYSHIAMTHIVDLVEEFAIDYESSIITAFEAARNALSFDNEDSLGHTALAAAYRWTKQHDLAVAEAKKAVELNPSDAFAYMWLGNLLDLSGQPDAAISYLKMAVQLSPRDPRLHLFAVAFSRVYLNSRDYPAATEWARKARSTKHEDPRGHVIYAIALAHLNRIEEAQAALAVSEEIRPGFAKKWAGNRRYLNSSDQEHLMAGLQKAGLSE